MAQPPDEIVRLILRRNFSIQELCQLLSVCKQWNQVLASKVLWRHVELGKHIAGHPQGQHPATIAEHETYVKLLELASERSGRTLDTFIYPNSHPGYRQYSFVSILELSKSTLRRIDLPLGADYTCEQWMKPNVLLFFKKFEKLERLKISGGFLPDIEPAERGKLTSLSLRYDDQQRVEDEQLEQWQWVLGATRTVRRHLISSSSEDQEWLSHLKVLHFNSSELSNVVPDNLIDILEACNESLIELKTNCSYHGSDEIRVKELEMPNLETLTVVKALKVDGAYDFVKAPKLKELNTDLNNISKLPFKELSSLGFIVTYRDQPEPEEQCQMILEGIKLNGNTLRELQFYPGKRPSANSFTLDPVLLQLKSTSTQNILCPNLSSIIIDEENPSLREGRIYDERLLAEMLLSRRLASRSTDSTQENRSFCSEVTAYIPGDDVSTFRAAEEEILAGLSEGEREMVGKAQVKTLQEIEKVTYWERCSMRSSGKSSN